MNDEMRGMSEEQLDEELKRKAAAVEIMRPCPHCESVPEILARTPAGLPKVVGLTHEKECPDYIPE